MLRRLRERVDRNVRLVDRMRADPLAPEPPGLPELIDTARRMRHDAETLMLLAGIDAGPRPGAPARLSALLDEAVDATDEPMRVDVRSGPNATVEPGAAIELLHVVSEVVDHVTAIHPGARVEVASRTEAPGGIVVEIRTASTTRYDPSGRRGMAAASRIAQRSRSGIVLRTPLPGPAGTGAPIATIHCPARAVTVHELDYSPWPAEPSYDAVGRPGLGGSNGTLRHEETETPAHGLPLGAAAASRRQRTTVEALFSELTAETNARASAQPPAEDARFGAYGRASELRATVARTPSTSRSTSSSGRWSTCPPRRSPRPRRSTRPSRRSGSATTRPTSARPTGSHPATGSGGPPPSAPTSSRRTSRSPPGGCPGAVRARGWCRPACPTAGAGDGAGRGGAHARPARRRGTRPTAFPTGSASGWPPTSAGCARAGTAPSRSTRAIPPPGSGLLLVVPNPPVVAPRG